MKVFIVLAHPEPTSLTGSLASHAAAFLRKHGHEVQASDLYAMRFTPAHSRDDFPAWPPDKPLQVMDASKQAFEEGTLTPDVKAEQRKLLWADVVILAFPIWWERGTHAGWVDRVYSNGFGYGHGRIDKTNYFDRFGQGVGEGKRAMLLVTAGGYDTHYSERGINGDLDSILFPIQHGMLWYIGLSVLPPFVVFRAVRMEQARYDQIARDLEVRLSTLDTTPPIQYRRQNFGDYEVPSLVLKEGKEREGVRGLAIHLEP